MKNTCIILGSVFILLTMMSASFIDNYIHTKNSTMYPELLESYDNLLEMPDFILDSWVHTIVNCFIDKDATDIENHTHYFTEDAYEKITNSIENVTPIGIYTTDTDSRYNYIRTINVEHAFNYANYFVIMCNFVIEHPNVDFSGVYLLELHGNTSGKITGFNIWQY